MKCRIIYKVLSFDLLGVAAVSSALMRPLFAVLLILLSGTALAGDLSYDCHGQTRFVHRGAPSTYPADDKRSYQISNNLLDAMQCETGPKDITCFGLTAQQAMRRVRIDISAKTVTDKLELPTSELIFEGRCN